TDVHTLNVGRVGGVAGFNGLTGGLFINGGAFRTKAASGGGSITAFAGGGAGNGPGGGRPTGSLTIRAGTLNVLSPVISTLNATGSEITMGGGTVSSGTNSAMVN